MNNNNLIDEGLFLLMYLHKESLYKYALDKNMYTELCVMVIILFYVSKKKNFFLPAKSF